MKTQKGFISLIIVLVIAFIVWLFIWNFGSHAVGHYSDGERTGLVNKLSKKVLICKTYEGYMLVGNGQNIMPEQFNFTVKNQEVADKVNAKLGTVATLTYDQKLITSNCWGNTSYEIIDVK